MSAINRQKIKETIAQIGQAGAYEVHLGKVKDVSESDATMSVDVLGLTIYDVRLRAVITDDTGMWVLPKIGSYVVIGQIEGGIDHVLLQASEIDKVFVKIAGKTLVMDTNGFVFNGGNNKGLVKLDAVVDRLNKIEDDVNDLRLKLKTALNPVLTIVTEPGNGAVSALQTSLKSALSSWLSQNLVTTTSGQLENPDVTH